MWRLSVLLTCLSALSACDTLRHGEQPVPATAAPVAADAASDATPAAEPDGAAADSTPAVGDADTVPPCVPPQEKPKAKVKPRPKRLVVHQEPTPAPQRAVAETPVNAPVDADLKLLNSSVESVLGRKVQGLNGEDFGRVVDVLADGSGRVRAAVVDYGGFLGVGNRRIAVDWALLRADPEHPEQPLTLRITREKLQSAPAYKDSARPPTLMVP